MECAKNLIDTLFELQVIFARMLDPPQPGRGKEVLLKKVLTDKTLLDMFVWSIHFELHKSAKIFQDYILWCMSCCNITIRKKKLLKPGGGGYELIRMLRQLERMGRPQVAKEFLQKMKTLVQWDS